MRYTLLCLVVLATSATAQTVRVVPTEYPSIQSAIDAAGSDDLVLVMPGVYRERIEFKGRPVRVSSLAGPVATTIDGGGEGTVVTFDHGERRDTLLEGFRITGGAHPVNAGGVHIAAASPTLRNNVITANSGGRRGHGVSVLGSADALLTNNVISANRSWKTGNGAGGGGGIGVYGFGAVEIRSNLIRGNSVSRFSSGGGIYLLDVGAAQVVGNVIEGNSARLAGAGIAVHGDSAPRIENNLIVANQLTEPGFGGGVQWLITVGGRGPDLIGNTIVANSAEVGAGIYADGDDHRARIVNNLILAPQRASAVECGDFADLLPPQVHHNNAFSGGQSYAGLCADAIFGGDNLSAKPKFMVDSWQPAADSPGIDGGDAAAAGERWDLVGNPRACGSAGGQVPRVDIGAYEHCAR